MERNGWEHYELEKEIAKSNMAQLLELFKRESDKYTQKCIEFAKSLSKLTDEGRKEIEDEARLLHEGMQKISLVIAEVLTDTKRTVKNR